LVFSDVAVARIAATVNQSANTITDLELCDSLSFSDHDAGNL
jgi:hypothetical protein